MPKTQASLTSFFGAKKAPAEQKENATPTMAFDSTTSHKRGTDADAERKKKRRVLEDSSDDDDEEEEEMQLEKDMPKAETTEDTNTEVINNADMMTTSTTTSEPKGNVKTAPDESKAPIKVRSGGKSKPSSKEPTARAEPSSASSLKKANKSSASKPVDSAKPTSIGTSRSTTSASETTTTTSSTAPIAPDRQQSLLANALKVKTDDALLQETNFEDTLPYSVLCEAFSKIEAITSRLAIQEIVTNLFRQVLLRAPADMYPALYLASNSVAPAYECVELGIGDALLIKAIAEATGTTPNVIKQKYETDGDLGIVAQNCRGKQKTLGGFFKTTSATAAASKKGLTVREVLSVFRVIAETKGNHAQKDKVDRIKKMLVRATDPTETRYIIRGLQGKLRIGLAQSTVLISLAHALALTPPPNIISLDAEGSDETIPDEARDYMDLSLVPEKRLEAAVSILKKAYSEVPSYDAILDAAMKVPLQDMHKACTLTPGIPVSPMLAKPTKSIQEVLKRLNRLKFTCEYKYDGERAQIHLLPNGRTKVFSRNLLDTSEKYPEVPLFVKEAVKDNKVDSFVLDAEVVAFNNKTGQFVPFQILSTRKKTEESAETAKVQVIVEAFDLMYLNGQSLLNKTLAERRQMLYDYFALVPGKFRFAEAMDHVENGDTTVIEDFLEAAVKGQCEGLMIKTLEVNAIYEPSRRSLNWLKLKKDYLQGLGDSVDLVPLGAYHGRGKRTGVYGAYLLACYDPDTEEFQSVCKIGTGFSDEDLKTLAESLNMHIIPQKSSQYNVSDQLECDVWFEAVQVWEVKAADLSKSSAHRGAEGKTGEEGRGIGLRFPRFERVRDDKRVEQATSSDQILEMYYAQDSVVGGDAGDDDGI